MDLGTLAARRQLATEQLVAAAQALGKQYGLEAEAEAVKNATAKDPAVKGLYQLEAAAALMEAIAKATSAAPDVDATPAAVSLADAPMPKGKAGTTKDKK